MFKFTFLLLYIFNNNIACEAINNKIIQNGHISIEEFPYIVSVRYNDNHICGGAILNKNTILTSAQCIFDLKGKLKYVSIRAGSAEHKNGLQFKAVQMKQHPLYKREYHENDIGIIKIGKPLSWDTNIQRIILADYDQRIPDESHAVFVGWGATKDNGVDVSDVLLKTDVTTMSYLNCTYQYGANMIHPKLMICAQAKNKEICRGDLGGPLVRNKKLVGIASWIYDCDISKYPGVYSNIVPHLDWINNFLK